MQVLVILSFYAFQAVHTFDWTEQAFKIVDWNVSPCENFYRHACPIGSPMYLPQHIQKEAVERAAESSSVLESLEISVSFDIIKLLSQMKVISSDISLSRAFYRICTEGGNTSEILIHMENILSDGTECRGPFCISHLSRDHDCRRVSLYLVDVLRPYRKQLDEYVQQSIRKLMSYAIPITYIELYLHEHLQEEMVEMKHLIEELKGVALEMIEMTPWARNHNVTELISFVASSLNYDPDAEKQKNGLLKILKAADEKLSKCKTQYPSVNTLDKTVLCLLSIERDLGVNADMDFYNLVEAFTIFPKLGFGFSWLYMIQNTPIQAAKFGAPGFAVAHEISHALIKSAPGDIITYFSKNATKCVQEQYEASCEMFKESSCSVRDDMFDENGADVYGMQIAYTLLERYYKGKEFEKTSDIPYANVTNPSQLFFYSSAFSLCSGKKASGYKADGKLDEHSATNVRINAMVNHPTFQQAFQCPDDSRMMKSKTNHCSIYGKSAPEHRRFHSK